MGCEVLATNWNRTCDPLTLEYKQCRLVLEFAILFAYNLVCPDDSAISIIAVGGILLQTCVILVFLLSMKGNLFYLLCFCPSV